MIRFVTLAFLTLLAACQLVETPTDEGGVAAPPPLSADATSPLLLEQQCKAAGGKMVIGLAGPQCARPQPDAGKACTDGSDCAGVCLAKSRTCSPVTPFFGCHDILQGGKPATICID